MSKVGKPTEKQSRVLEWILDFRSTNGFPPTAREVGSAMGYTTTAARHHLIALRRRGLVTWQDGIKRSLVVV